MPTTSTATARGPDHQPYAQHDVVDSTYYTQISIVRTIEQILGAQPLNQKLAAATPMFGAFTNTPNYTPFTAVPNQVPLTEGVSPAPTCGADTTATNGGELSLRRRPRFRTQHGLDWSTWATRQHLTGATAIPDYANPEQMNRYTWYRANGFTKPYPGDTKIYAPTQVPGAYIPSADNN